MEIFNKNAIGRISTVVPWAESEMNSGGGTHGSGDISTHEVVYAKLTENIGNGYWKAEETIFTEGEWTSDNERVWDGESQDYVRHFNWGAAQINQVVKLFRTLNSDDNIYEWVS